MNIEAASLGDSTKPLRLTSDLEPLPYQKSVRDYLKSSEAGLWSWFEKTKTQEKHAEAVRFELLKTTYRVSESDEPKLYDQAQKVASSIGVDIPITLYRAQSQLGLNASICNMTDEAHIVFRGPLTKALTKDELDALLAHELAHLKLWKNWDKDFLTTELILSALTNDAKAQPAHFETARLFSLYTEIYCDRASLQAVDNAHNAISMLVKVTTNVDKVNPASYLSQAEEIVNKGELGSEGITHPETFIRALALNKWAKAKSATEQSTANQDIEDLIAGDMNLQLDLLGQQEMVRLTRRFIDYILKPKWMQTNLTLAHAKAFIHDYTAPPEDHADEELLPKLQTMINGKSNRKKNKTTAKGAKDDPANEFPLYFIYVLLDFAAADRDLEHAPLAWALQVVERIGIKLLFIDVARKELRLRKKQIDEIEKASDTIIKDAETKRREPTNTDNM